ncbi:MAG: hypothetical protein HY329_11855 [Chloroflexi bacterium]|nr:hypothetical protein [Chloroflexota bacterium]
MRAPIRLFLPSGGAKRRPVANDDTGRPWRTFRIVTGVPIVCASCEQMTRKGWWRSQPGHELYVCSRCVQLEEEA